MTVAAATAMVVCTNNNKLKEAVEEMAVAAATAMATATAMAVAMATVTATTINS